MSGASELLKNRFTRSFIINGKEYEEDRMNPEIKEGDIFTTEIKMFVLTADCIDETLKGVKFIEDFGHDMICPYKKAIKVKLIRDLKDLYNDNIKRYGSSE